MAVLFLNNIDLSNNQALNMRLQNLSTANDATAAAAGAGGIIFYSSGNVNRPQWSDGTKWNPIFPASAAADATTVALRTNQGNLVANAFVGPLTGNADTATKLFATKNIGITGKATATAAAFDGSSNVNIDITGLSVATGDITLASGSFIIGDGSGKGAATTKTSIPLSGFGAPTEAVSMGSQRITNLAAPQDASDAATRAYVDAAAVGLKVKEAAKYATTAALPAYSYNSAAIQATSNGALTIDGLTPAVNDRILVRNEPVGAADPRNAKRNGIYTVTQVGSVSTPFILTRATDFDQSAETVPGSFVFVTNGDTLNNTGWVMSAAGPITLDTSDIIWSQFSGTGQIDAGAGLTKTGNQINVVGTANRIVANTDSIDIASTYAGQATITTLGTVTTGTWNGARIQPEYGGTGLTTYTAGSILYASAATTIAQLTAVATGSVLISAGVTTAPAWGKVGLTTHVDGVLAVGNGGTGVNTLTAKGVLIGAGTDAVISRTTSTAGQILVSAATTFDPTWTTISGDATLGSDGALTIGNKKITYAKIQDVGARSVIGNSTANSGVAAEITAGTDYTVLRRSGTTIGFGAISLNQSAAVTGILPSANGGTGSARFAVAGPTSARTYTFSDSDCNIPAIFAGTITGTGNTASFSVQHNLNTKDVLVQVYSTTGASSSTPSGQVFTDVAIPSGDAGKNAVTIVFATNVPSDTTYRVVVVGYGSPQVV